MIFPWDYVSYFAEELGSSLSSSTSNFNKFYRRTNTRLISDPVFQESRLCVPRQELNSRVKKKLKKKSTHVYEKRWKYEKVQISFQIFSQAVNTHGRPKFAPFDTLVKMSMGLKIVLRKFWILGFNSYLSTYKWAYWKMSLISVGPFLKNPE